MLSLCPFDISVGVGAFVIGLSQISSFFSRIIALKLNNWRGNTLPAPHGKGNKCDFTRPKQIIRYRAQPTFGDCK